MEKLEGGGLAAPPPVLAYLAEEEGATEESREMVTVRRDSADGDVVEASFTADLQTLQRQLLERTREAEEAKRQAMELQNELSAARAETVVLRESLDAGTDAEETELSPPEEPEATTRLVSEAFAQLARVRTDSYKARVEMERERTAHRAEMVKARAQYNAAQDQLQKLIQTRRSPPPTPVRPPRPQPPVPPVSVTIPEEGRLPKILGGLAAVALGVGGVLAWPKVSQWSESRAVKAPVAIASAAPVMPATSIPLTPAARAQFQNAVGRLSRVLAGRPGRAPEDLLRQVHELYKNSDPNLCAFSWRNGQPSLVYGGGHLSIGQTIQRCADAVEKIP